MRLLVVEDERSLREDIARKLRLSGYAMPKASGTSKNANLGVASLNMFLLNKKSL